MGPLFLGGQAGPWGGGSFLEQLPKVFSAPGSLIISPVPPL